MAKLKKLSQLLEEIEDNGVHPEDIVVDPKAVHVITDEDWELTYTENEV